MVRCLAIFFCLLLTKLNFGQCTNIPIESYNCSTGTLNYSLVINGTAPYSFTVTPFFPFSVSGNTLTMTFTTAVGSILITYKDANNCVSQGNPVINAATFNQYFAISTLSPFTKTVTCFGANDGALAFTVTGSSVVLPVTYSVNGVAISSNTVNNLSAGIYTIVAQGADGCKRTETISIIQSNQIATTSTSSVSCFSGTTNAVLSTTGGIGAMSYTVNGNAIPNNTVTGLTAGNYTVITKDVNGCMATNTITITQPPATVFNFIQTQPTCPTSSNGALSVNIINMQAPYNYTWTAPTNTNSSLSNIPAGMYTLTVKDVKNCVFSNTFQLIPLSNIQTTVHTKPETCSAVDAAVTINVTGGTLPLSYSIAPFPAQSSNTFSNLATGLYSVIVTDANSCTLASTFSVGNTSPVQIAASFTDILCYNNCDGKIAVSVSLAIPPITYSLTNLPTFTTSNITGICAGTYTLKAVDNIGCYAITTVTFTNPAPYSFSVSGTSPICVGRSANLIAQANGGTAPYNYVWQPGSLTTSTVAVSPTVTTVYSLNVYDNNNCTLNPETFTVTVRAPLTVSVSPQNSGICPGTTAQITPSVSGGDGNYSYLWLPGNNNTSSIFISNLTTPTYSFIVSDGCGSPTKTTVINLQIFPVTIPTFTSDTAMGCQPLCVHFKNTTPTSTNHYWNFGDVPFEQNVQDPFYCYTRSGIFNVKLSLTDLNGCKVSATYSNYINVLQQPTPNFITKPGVLTDDLGQGQLVNASGNATSVKWFIDGVYQGNSNSAIIPCTDTLCYIIKLLANNSNGCKDSLERLVCVKPGFSFYMPNTFSPNNDGLNEELLPYGRSWVSDNYKFRIFNRWGQMIFQTNDISKGWDGRVRGTAVVNDNYYWMVNVTDYYGNEHAYQGHVVLLR